MKLKGILCGGLLTLAFAVPASADPITGTMNFTGSVRVSATTIDWVPLDGTEGDLFTGFPATEYFSNIYNPASNPPYTGDSLDLTAGVLLPLPNYLNDFDTPTAEYDDLSFTLTQIKIPVLPVCTGAETIGQSCVAFLGSPFILTRTANGSSVEFDIAGFWVDPTFGDNGSLNTAIGVYTSPDVALTPIQIRNIILAGGHVDATYAANITATAVPEPLTLTLLGSGLLGIGLRARRRRA
jgi:hypothetical protein